MRPSGLGLAALLIVASFSTAWAADPPTFAGKWKLTKMMIAGQPAAPTEIGNTVLEIKDGKYVVTKDETKVDSGTIKIEGDAAPFRIEITSETPGAPTKIIGIGKIEGEIATFALQLSGEELPTTFESEKGSELTKLVATYELQK